MKVGIIGGGQLSRMLVEAALNPDQMPAHSSVQPVVYSASKQTPAALVAPENFVGPLGPDYESPELLKFFKNIEVCIFENEFLNCPKLAELTRGLPLRFAPGLNVIERLQDKLNQKRIFESSGLPSSRYEVWDGSGVQDWLKDIASKFTSGAVFKWSRMGYDGKGVLIAGEMTSAEKKSEIRVFCEEGLSKGAQIYVEEKIPFVRELAIVACHSLNGKFLAYPLVISEQQSGICKRVVGPASRFGADPALMQEAHRCAEVIARATGIIGTFAIEFFEDDFGKLLINEVAPRVHNSGHFTQDAASTSQFANHWRAVLGLPLGRVDCHEVFAMFNLLGPEGVNLDLDPPLLPKVSENVALHWYFKNEIRRAENWGISMPARRIPASFPRAYVNWRGPI